MTIPLFDIAAQNRSLGEELDCVLRDTIASSRFIGGEAVARFETDFADYCGVAHCVSCASGTDALEIAMEALGLESGDEVIVPAMTWVSTAEAVARIGCVPVFADVLPDEWTLDPAAVAKAVTPRTRAIVPVHLYGRPARMEALAKLCRDHDLFLIEDCAQAHGATIGSAKVGTFGDASIFSFFPTKNLGALGDGGAMLFRDGEVARRARLIASHGQEERHRHVIIGRNSRLDALNAAVLSIKLPRLEGWIAAKERLARSYREAWQDLPIGCPAPLKSGQHGWHIFAISCDRRDELMAHLDSHGMQTAIHYPTILPEQPAFRPFDPDPAISPVSRGLADTVLSIPIYPELSGAGSEHVIAAVKSFFA